MFAPVMIKVSAYKNQSGRFPISEPPDSIILID